MALALNNPRRLICCYWNQTKPIVKILPVNFYSKTFSNRFLDKIPLHCISIAKSYRYSFIRKYKSLYYFLQLFAGFLKPAIYHIWWQKSHKFKFSINWYCSRSISHHETEYSVKKWGGVSLIQGRVVQMEGWVKMF